MTDLIGTGPGTDRARGGYGPLGASLVLTGAGGAFVAGTDEFTREEDALSYEQRWTRGAATSAKA